MKILLTASISARFLSTPSGWRATFPSCLVYHTDYISIHALRVEGDGISNSIPSLLCNFYPRPPGGGRQGSVLYTGCPFLFLSTPSGWRATPRSILCVCLAIISIHALRVEGDQRRSKAKPKATDFYPRPPGGGRQQKRTKFSSVFAQKGEEFASLRRGKRKICRWRFKKDKFWVLIWCEGSGKSVCALASHCG